MFPLIRSGASSAAMLVILVTGPELDGDVFVVAKVVSIGSVEDTERTVLPLLPEELPAT
jgi:hypothetical protein